MRHYGCGVTSPDKPAYRPDIDGLRAVAVLGVIGFHAGFQWITGGYVGVDVFFVISGFLITGILRRELSLGRFSLARFYERRVRRILPALLVLLAATLMVSILVLLPPDRRIVARSVVGVLVFAANVLFWRGVDFTDATLINYFGDKKTDEQPLLHTWSLGVEEPYYLLFPVALVIAWRVKRAWVFPLLVAGTAGSLALSAVLTPRSPGVAFYLLPARIWEFLAGGLLAWRAGRPAAVHPVLHELAAAVGLALIAIAMLVYDDTTPFPGLHAAVPVAGALLVIHSAPGTAVGRALSRPAVVFVGLMSYSAYLWHQLLFATARYVSLDGEMSTMVAIGLCVLTLVLAAITWRLVETPFRDRQLVSTRVLLSAVAVGVAAVAIPAAVLGFGGIGTRRSPMATGLAGQAILTVLTDCNTSLQPSRSLGPGCLLNPSSAEPPSFLVLGDSHAESLYPALARFSHATGQQGRLLQHFGCSPLFDIADQDIMTGCRLTLQQARDVIAEHRLTRVVVVSRFSNEYRPRETFAPRFEKMIAGFAARGVMVYIVRQAPEHPRFDRRQYLRAVLGQRFFGIDATTEIQRMTSSRAEHEQRQQFVNGVFASHQHDPRVRFVDFTSALCDATDCTLGTTSTPYYADTDHMNFIGALTVSDVLTRQLLEVW